jgi:hypothetical protein
MMIKGPPLLGADCKYRGSNAPLALVPKPVPVPTYLGTWFGAVTCPPEVGGPLTVRLGGVPGAVDQVAS